MKISLSSGKIITGSPDNSILESLKNEGVFLTSSCGSKGTCGKCKIVIRSGEINARSAIKLTHEELKKNYALACQSFPLGDISIEIPKESPLTLEGRIATGRSKDLQALLHSAGVKIEPLTERIVLHLPTPSLNDNISDLERLKRELVSKGLGCLRVPFRFLTGLAEKVRKNKWEITLSVIYSEDCNEITNIFPGDKKSKQYGIAIDIGTTTLVV
ncbi:MAG: 2Fe-2S iron-sulfur cluster binding domain-containing protein [Nitrospirae bacterium]|nr:2Fe-2S iron-sulfur cluster binding domain-containing protein [Nitrospirota bacterium]